MKYIELGIARLAGDEPAHELGIPHWGDAERAVAREYLGDSAAVAIPLEGGVVVVAIVAPDGGGWGVVPQPDGAPVCWPLGSLAPRGVPGLWTAAAWYAARRAGRADTMIAEDAHP